MRDRQTDRQTDRESWGRAGEDKMDTVIEKLRAFNDAYMASYAD
jgi:hypothetical protein